MNNQFGLGVSNPTSLLVNQDFFAEIRLPYQSLYNRLILSEAINRYFLMVRGDYFTRLRYAAKKSWESSFIIKKSIVHCLNFRYWEKCNTELTMSQVWRHYEQGRAEDGCKLGKCRICENILRCAGSNTSALWSHLQKNHEEEHAALVKKGAKAAPKNAIGKQPTIEGMISSRTPYGPSHKKQKQFDKNLKEMFVHDCLPFSLANSGTFRKTVTDLDPKIKVKQGRTYSKYVRNDEQKVKKSIKSLLRKNVKGVLGLTADMWDDRK